MSDWTGYLAIGLAGVTSLSAVWALALRPRSIRNQLPDSGAMDNRRRLDDIDRKLTLLNRYVEEQIPRVVADSLRTQIASVRVHTGSPDGDAVVGNGPPQAAVAREISHSLNTPLAQIEAGVLSMSDVTAEQRRKLDGILDAVGICKSFLAAFREAATLAPDSEAWSPDSLGDALRAAAALYAARAGGEPKVEVRAPQSLPGYSNNYVMAVLLPLLENAMEAVPPDGSVSVHVRRATEGFRLSVSNDTIETGLPNSVYRVGYTTKQGHDGLGLPSVRRLLALREAHIGHGVADGRTTFTIDLPRGRR
jgi:signal transduction histidine kinase